MAWVQVAQCFFIVGDGISFLNKTKSRIYCYLLWQNNTLLTKGTRKANIIMWCMQGIARRLIKLALEEAAKKREMRYSDLKKIERGIRRHFHDDITVIVVFLDHALSLLLMWTVTLPLMVVIVHRVFQQYEWWLSIECIEFKTKKTYHLFSVAGRWQVVSTRFACVACFVSDALWGI